MPYASPKPPPNFGWLRCGFEGVNNGTDWAVVHWFATEYSTEPTPTQLNAVVDGLAGAFGDNLISVNEVSSEVQLTRVIANLTLADPPSRLRTVRIADAVGSGSGAAEAGQVCFLIDWQTVDGRRGGKPRSYIPGPLNADLIDQGRLSSSAITNMTAAANAYHNAVNDILAHVDPGPFTTLSFIDASFVNNKDYRSVAVGFEIFSGICSGVVATQRRRVDRLRA